MAATQQTGIMQLFLLLLALLIAAPTSALIIDTGDVFVSQDNELVVGNVSDGQRLNDGMEDGPYDSVTVGANFGAHGELLLENKARMIVSGRVQVADEGGGRLNVSGGSQLAADSLGMLASGADARFSISGPGSQLNLSGRLDAGGLDQGAIDVSVSQGAMVSASGVAVGGRSNNGSTDVVIKDAGTIWQNSGSLWVGGSSTYRISSGSQVVDGDVATQSFEFGKLVVEGPGTTWVTGELGLSASGTVLSIENGSHVTSASATFNSAQTGTVARVSGLGSEWMIRGELDATSCGGGCAKAVQVEEGGRITSDSVLLASDGGSARITVSGDGSRMSIDSSLTVSRFTDNDTEVRVESGGLVEVSGSSSISEGAKLVVDVGTFSSDLLSLSAEGALAGVGTVVGDVLNAGVVSPTAGLAIDGSYRQQQDGMLRIQLDGGSEALLDVLSVSVLSGKLEVSLAEGFVPRLGDEFVVMNASEITGKFDLVAGLDPAGSPPLRVDYLPTSVVITAVPEPSVALLLLGGIVALCALRGQAH